MNFSIFFPLSHVAILFFFALFLPVSAFADAGVTHVSQAEVRVAAPQFPERVHSDLTRLISGEIPGASYDRRIRAVATPGKSISAEDFSALQAFLEKAPADDPETPARLDAIKNDVAAKLLSCEHFPDGFSRRFLSMLSNPDVGLVW